MTAPTGCCPGSSISANGQNLLRKPSQMDLTKVQFRCWDRMLSSSSTQTGVTTSNRRGYLAIVSLMSLYWKSLQGTAGTGKAVSVYVAEGVQPTLPVLKANLMNRGLLPSSWYLSSPPLFPLLRVIGTLPLGLLTIA